MRTPSARRWLPVAAFFGVFRPAGCDDRCLLCHAMTNCGLLLYVQVPDYSEYVQQPMDFSSMRDKLEKYCSVAEFTRDFELVMANCLSYNDSDTVYYKAAVQLRDEVSLVICFRC